MAVLNHDSKYDYCKQLSLWVDDINLILFMLEPFEKYPERAQHGVHNCVVRKSNRDKYAVFVYGHADAHTRYKLDVILKARVIVLGEFVKSDGKHKK